AQRPAFLLGERLLVGALGRAGFVLIPTRVELPDEALVIAVPHRGADNFHRLLGDDHQRRADAHPILPRAVAFDSAQAVATVIEYALLALLVAGGVGGLRCAFTPGALKVFKALSLHGECSVSMGLTRKVLREYLPVKTIDDCGMK